MVLKSNAVKSQVPNMNLTLIFKDFISKIYILQFDVKTKTSSDLLENLKVLNTNLS